MRLNLPIHLQWACGLTSAALNILNSQVMVNLHGCSELYIFSLIDLISRGFDFEQGIQVNANVL